MPSIPWNDIALALKYADPPAMWYHLYIEKRLSLNQLAIRFSVSTQTIRSQLAQAGIHVRGPGGPNNVKLDISKVSLEEVEERGIAAVARDHGVSRTTLYKRLYYAKGKKKTRRGQPTSDATTDPESEASPNANDQ